MYDTKADLDEFTVRIARPSILGSTYSSSPIFANEWIARANTTNIKYILLYKQLDRQDKNQIYCFINMFTFDVRSWNYAFHDQSVTISNQRKIG